MTHDPGAKLSLALLLTSCRWQCSCWTTGLWLFRREPPQRRSVPPGPSLFLLLWLQKHGPCGNSMAFVADPDTQLTATATAVNFRLEGGGFRRPYGTFILWCLLSWVLFLWFKNKAKQELSFYRSSFSKLLNHYIVDILTCIKVLNLKSVFYYNETNFTFKHAYFPDLMTNPQANNVPYYT